MNPPRLLHFRISHYNEKVRWALDHKGIQHHRTALVPGFHIPRIRRLTGQNKVPVLLVDGRALFGSAAIIEELERLEPDPPLYPADSADRERALGIQRFFDDEVAPRVRRLFWSCYIGSPAECARMATAGASGPARFLWRAAFPGVRIGLRRNIGIDQARVQEAEGQLGSIFDRLEREIGASGYLVGDRFGIADLAAAAILSGIVRPPEFPYPLPEPRPAALLELQARWRARAGYRWAEETYARHRSASAEIVP